MESAIHSVEITTIIGSQRWEWKGKAFAIEKNRDSYWVKLEDGRKLYLPIVNTVIVYTTTEEN